MAYSVSNASLASYSNRLHKLLDAESTFPKLLKKILRRFLMLGIKYLAQHKSRIRINKAKIIVINTFIFVKRWTLSRDVVVKS